MCGKPRNIFLNHGVENDNKKDDGMNQGEESEVTNGEISFEECGGLRMKEEKERLLK